MYEPYRGPGAGRINRLNRRPRAGRGILVGTLLGVLGPFIIQFASPLLTLAGALLGWFKTKQHPEDVYWRSFAVTCAVWFLINGSCAGLLVWAFSHGRGD